MVAAGAATLAQSFPCCKLMYNDFTLVQRLMLYGMCAPATIAMHHWVLLMRLWRRLLVFFFVLRDSVGLSDCIRLRSFRPALDEEKYRRDGSDSFCVMEHDPFWLVLTSGILLCRGPTASRQPLDLQYHLTRTKACGGVKRHVCSVIDPLD